MYSIEQFRDRNRPEFMVLTQYSRKRFAERGISIDDVCFVFKTGKIMKGIPHNRVVEQRGEFQPSAVCKNLDYRSGKSRTDNAAMAEKTPQDGYTNLNLNCNHMRASFPLCRCFTAINDALHRLSPFSLGRTKNPLRI